MYSLDYTRFILVVEAKQHAVLWICNHCKTFQARHRLVKILRMEHIKCLRKLKINNLQMFKNSPDELYLSA